MLNFNVEGYQLVQLLDLLSYGHNICVLLHTWLCCRVMQYLQLAVFTPAKCFHLVWCFASLWRLKIMLLLVPPKNIFMNCKICILSWCQCISMILCLIFYIFYKCFHNAYITLVGRGGHEAKLWSWAKLLLSRGCMVQSLRKNKI